MITVDGKPIESLRLTHAMGSHWTARVSCEDYAAVVGAEAVIDGDGTIWRGRITHRTTIGGGSVNLTITGGAGDWLAEIDSDHWIASTTVGEVAGVLAAKAGATAGPSLVALPQWLHSRSRLASALNVLARWGGVEWYQQPGGEIAFDAPAGEALAEPVDDDGETLTYDVGARLPFLLSATVGRALYLCQQGAVAWTVTVWPRRVATPSRPSGWVGATVEAQSDELVDLRLDDGSTRTEVPLWSCPGVRARVPNGTRVLVYSVAGDPRATIAFASQWTADVDSLDLAGAEGIALRSGDITSIRNLDGSPLSGPLAPLSSIPLRFDLHDSVAAMPGPPGIGHSKVNL